MEKHFLRMIAMIISVILVCTALAYTYGDDGTISRAVCEKVEYDSSGNETYRREEEL